VWISSYGIVHIYFLPVCNHRFHKFLNSEKKTIRESSDFTIEFAI
jgi:hypothetical protein